MDGSVCSLVVDVLLSKWLKPSKETCCGFHPSVGNQSNVPAAFLGSGFIPLSASFRVNDVAVVVWIVTQTIWWMLRDQMPKAVEIEEIWIECAYIEYQFLCVISELRMAGNPLESVDVARMVRKVNTVK